MVLLSVKNSVVVCEKQRSILLPNRLKSWTLKSHATTTLPQCVQTPTGPGNTLAPIKMAKTNWQLLRAESKL